jgi:hypothetical protein
VERTVLRAAEIGGYPLVDYLKALLPAPLFFSVKRYLLLRKCCHGVS